MGKILKSLASILHLALFFKGLPHLFIMITTNHRKTEPSICPLKFAKWIWFWQNLEWGRSMEIMPTKFHNCWMSIIWDLITYQNQGQNSICAFWIVFPIMKAPPCKMIHHARVNSDVCFWNHIFMSTQSQQSFGDSRNQISSWKDRFISENAQHGLQFQSMVLLLHFGLKSRIKCL